MNDLNNVAKLS